MNSRRTTSGLLLLVALAGIGFLLATAPSWLADQYQKVSDSHPALAYTYLGIVLTGGILLLGASITIALKLWGRGRRKRQRREQQRKNPSELTSGQKEQEIQNNLAAVEDLRDDEAIPSELRSELEPIVQQVMEKREEQTLEIVAFGTISSGKSSLLNALAGRDVFQTDPKGGTTIHRNEIPWPGLDRVMLVDTPGISGIDGAEHAAVAAGAAKDADLVLLVVDGPLKDSEFRLLSTLGEMEKRILICLNKGDWYDQQQTDSLLDQLGGQVKGVVSPEDVVAVQSEPVERMRVRVMSDGREVEEPAEVAPDIGPLADRMLQIVRHDGRELLLANLLLQSRGMVEEARERVRQSLDRRAWEIVDKYMWAAGGAAAVSPLPVLDLMAGGAVTTKMVVQLARVYRQDIDLDTAVTLLGQLGKNLLGILGASAATPAVASLAASMLKSVPGAGTMAGGLLQGIVQAVVTRWIGAVFIQYYKNEMQETPDGLASLARRQWEQMTTVAELSKVIKSARTRLAEVESEDDGA